VIHSHVVLGAVSDYPSVIVLLRIDVHRLVRFTQDYVTERTVSHSTEIHIMVFWFMTSYNGRIPTFQRAVLPWRPWIESSLLCLKYCIKLRCLGNQRTTKFRWHFYE